MKNELFKFFAYWIFIFRMLKSNIEVQNSRQQNFDNIYRIALLKNISKETLFNLMKETSP